MIAEYPAIAPKAPRDAAENTARERAARMSRDRVVAELCLLLALRRQARFSQSR